MNQNELECLSRFISRESEMAELRAKWNEVQQGSPRLLVLLADTGLGKTRLIHEFYRQISVEENAGKVGEGYWPDRLDSDPIGLRINPPPPPTPRKMEEMPWFWWGLRWEKPDQRNAGGHGLCALLNQDAQAALAQHYEPLARYIDRQHSAKKVLKSVGDFALSIGLAATPLAGVFEIYDKGKNLYEILESGRYWLGTVANTGTAIDASLALAARLGEATSRASAFLTGLMDADRVELPTVPVILLLDDAQWADSYTLRFVRELFLQAAARNWHLLVVATCWETDWKQQQEAAPKNEPGSDPAGLAEMVRQIEALLDSAAAKKASETVSFVSTISLLPMTAETMAPLVTATFPGIDKLQRDFLLERADGNPRSLVDLLLHVKHAATKAWFEDGDATRRLTSLGMKKIRDLAPGHSGIVAQRLSTLENDSADIYRVLEISAAQGRRFYGDLSAETIRRLPPVGAPDVVRALQKAETPLNFITLFHAELLPAVFKDRLVAESLHETCCAEWPEASARLREVLFEWLDSGRVLALPNAPELCLLLIRLCDGLDDKAQQRVAAIRVYGHLIAILQSRSRYGEAVDQTQQLLAFAGEKSAAALGDILDAPTLHPVARCLIEARRFVEAGVLMTSALSQFAGSATPQRRAEWLMLRAKAEHGAEDYPLAEKTWRCALAEIPNAADGALRLLRGRVLFGLAKTTHAHTGWRLALTIYHRALREVDRDAGDDILRVRMAGKILTEIAEALYEGGRLQLAVRMICAAENRFDRCETAIGNVPALIEPFAHALSRHGEWQLIATVGGDYRDAERVLTRAVVMRETLIRMAGKTVEVLADLAASQSLLAAAYSEGDQEERALGLCEKAMLTRLEVCRRTNRNSLAVRQLSSAYFRRADIKVRFKRYDSALDDLNSAVQLRSELVAAASTRRDETTAQNMRLLLYALRKRGETLLALNRFGESRASFADAQAISETLLRDFGRNAIELRNAYVCLERMAQHAQATKEMAAARDLYAQALKLLDELDSRYGLSPSGVRDRERVRVALAAT
jgi:tetratricopeptide (TPR) repeat protein